ncbi:MAG: hypothetical protein RDV41_04090, partial [Planctomycetota bacterium]|nr:hypothetical protein [Planctomycetota bacterium]
METSKAAESAPNAASWELLKAPKAHYEEPPKTLKTPKQPGQFWEPLKALKTPKEHLNITGSIYFGIHFGVFS